MGEQWLAYSESKLVCENYLLVVEVLESNGYLILALLVEDDLEGTGVVIDLQDGPHGLVLLGSHSTHNDDLRQVKWSEISCWLII